MCVCDSCAFSMFDCFILVFFNLAFLFSNERKKAYSWIREEFSTKTFSIKKSSKHKIQVINFVCTLTALEETGLILSSRFLKKPKLTFEIKLNMNTNIIILIYYFIYIIHKKILIHSIENLSVQDIIVGGLKCFLCMFQIL